MAKQGASENRRNRNDPMHQRRSEQAKQDYAKFSQEVREMMPEGIPGSRGSVFFIDYDMTQATTSPADPNYDQQVHMLGETLLWGKDLVLAVTPEGVPNPKLAGVAYAVIHVDPGSEVPLQRQIIDRLTAIDEQNETIEEYRRYLDEPPRYDGRYDYRLRHLTGHLDASLEEAMKHWLGPDEDNEQRGTPNEEVAYAHMQAAHFQGHAMLAVAERLEQVLAQLEALNRTQAPAEQPDAEEESR